MFAALSFGSLGVEGMLPLTLMSFELNSMSLYYFLLGYRLLCMEFTSAS